ncbi:hypothetical protein BC833DRAFT_578852 [Globomyces pollinis-pini]|nr:hypothetical protein BC833DRAFT_578852 [Globomyces pollinis-pini]
MNNQLNLIQKALSNQDAEGLCRLLPWNQLELTPVNLRNEIQDLLKNNTNISKIIPDTYSNFIVAYLKFVLGNNFDTFLTMFKVYTGERLAYNVWLIPFTKHLIRGMVHLSILNDKLMASYSEKTRITANAELGRLCAMVSKDSSDICSILLYIVNSQFSVLFSLDGMKPSLDILRMLPNFLPTDLKCPKSDTVMFNFKAGKIALHFHRFAMAEKHFQIAFQKCIPTLKAKRTILLKYLIVIKMIRGVLPSEFLLKEFHLDQYFSNLCLHLSKGNFLMFTKELEIQRSWLLKNGLYLLIEQHTRIVLYRNLFQRIYRIMESNSISVSLLWQITQKMNADDTVEEIECLLVSMIDQGIIKGYISHDKNVIVFRKSNTFPLLHTIATQA